MCFDYSPSIIYVLLYNTVNTIQCQSEDQKRTQYVGTKNNQNTG